MKASVKYKVIYRHREKYSISEMCRFFEVSRSGYYDYVRRMDVPAKDLPLAEKIRECQSVCRNTYGYRRVHIWLERNGIHCNPKTVLRVMNKYNLLSVIRRKAYYKLTQRYGITPSMSRRGNPYDNALAENFFSILKTECIYRTKIAILAEARELIDDYIYFYNNQRIQTKTKLTPMEFRCQYVA